MNIRLHFAISAIALVHALFFALASLASSDAGKIGVPVSIAFGLVGILSAQAGRTMQEFEKRLSALEGTPGRAGGEGKGPA
ncbi:MAG: hypothetical protein Fur0037_05440 [Planctomycetota bacterium]